MAATYRLPRKYRYRRYGKRITREQAIGVAVAAVLIAAGGKAASHGHAIPAITTRFTVQDGGSLGTPSGWASALLAADGLPQTSCNMSAVTTWERAEGGGFGNQAAYDPLNVNPGAGANWPGYNAIGAWAFPNAADGLRYTVATLNDGYYGGILAALRAGDSAQAVCDAIENSPWAGSHYNYDLTASC
jgi:hypothetical protein